MYRVIFTVVFLLSGCTNVLWAPKHEEELVNGFYVNTETDELFVTTKEDAYVFPIDRSFGESLLLTREVAFYPTFKNFSIDEENRVKGVVTLVFVENEPSHTLVAKVKSLGFEEDELINRLRLSKEIKGRRYTIEGELPLEKLEKNYHIMVAQPAKFSETAGKIIATPVTIAYDAVVVVPAVFIGAVVMAMGSP
ncbi:hypothetical protein ACJJH9_09470 [Microbulbifer sp. DLAB2-AF]|uniref:hypothetical protein n=1 Tax=Microbulbifer sp. DLAB2-AF TaxID=3243395 RepID=UPI004039B13F